MHAEQSVLGGYVSKTTAIFESKWSTPPVEMKAVTEPFKSKY